MPRIPDEQSLSDLLDCIGFAFPGVCPAVLDECIGWYGKVLKGYLKSDGKLTDFTVIHHTETFHSRGTWAEDSLLDGGMLPVGMYHWNRFKQVASAQMGLGEGFVETAIADIIVRHGNSAAIVFLKRAWRCHMLVLSEHVVFPWWMLARAKVFGIEYQTSREEDFAATKSAKAKIKDMPLSSLAVAREIATIDRDKGRSAEAILQYYWEQRNEAELELKSLRKVTNQSDWLHGLRNLLPHFVVLECLAEEAEFISEDAERQREIGSLARFVDERKADIRTAAHTSFFVQAYREITAEKNDRTRRRRSEFYRTGRVIAPDFAFNRLEEMLKAKKCSNRSLEAYLTSTLRPGHRWYSNKFNKLMRDAAKKAHAAFQKEVK